MSSNPSSGAENYKLQIKESAAKELESLGTKKDREKIVARINALAMDPRPSGSEKLASEENKYRLRNVVKIHGAQHRHAVVGSEEGTTSVVSPRVVRVTGATMISFNCSSTWSR